MEKLLLFIKHRLRFLWGILEWGNSVLFKLSFSSKLRRVYNAVFSEYKGSLITYRKLEPAHSEALVELIEKQEKKDLEYFQPHGFALKDIRKQFNNHAFLMMGAFDQDDLVGYFFLRLFSNKKCFVGRLIDKGYRGRGIGQEMNQIMYRIAWQMQFRCLSTISKNNHAVMGAHAKNRAMVVLKELKDDYLLVEFVKEDAEKKL